MLSFANSFPSYFCKHNRVFSLSFQHSEYGFKAEQTCYPLLGQNIRFCLMKAHLNLFLKRVYVRRLTFTVLNMSCYRIVCSKRGIVYSKRTKLTCFVPALCQVCHCRKAVEKELRLLIVYGLHA